MRFIPGLANYQFCLHQNHSKVFQVKRQNDPGTLVRVKSNVSLLYWPAWQNSQNETMILLFTGERNKAVPTGLEYLRFQILKCLFFSLRSPCHTPNLRSDTPSRDAPSPPWPLATGDQLVQANDTRPFQHRRLSTGCLHFWRKSKTFPFYQLHQRFPNYLLFLWLK